MTNTMKNLLRPLAAFAAIAAIAIGHGTAHADSPLPGAGKHIVFVTGDEEYRSEETMPMLARILHTTYGFEVTVCYAMTDGVIDPNNSSNIEGLEALEDADMMVMNTRFRALPEEQLKYITDFAESGKPMAGFRTATHAFRYRDDDFRHMNSEWPQKVFGLPWIRHHGGGNSTNSYPVPEMEDHPVLRGVGPFHSRSWLYHATRLHENVEPLLIGRSVSGSGPDGDESGDPHAVAWIHSYEGSEGKTSRVFFTTLGHPEDFHNEELRKLSLNGFFWALGMEDLIPEDGLNADFVGEYEPNRAGTGNRYKQDLTPDDIPLK